ncbi:MAG: RNA polymerase sigma factor [Candidatus Muiribacteriaceae bacterium]
MKEKQISLLFDEHWKNLYFYAYSITHDSYEAMDIVQNSFIRLLEYDKEIKNIRAWLFMVTRNQCYDMFRRVKRLVVLKGEIATPEFDTDELGKYKKLFESMSLLRKKARDILYLRYYEQMSYEDMAEVLGISIGTVMSRLSRAKKALKEAMGDEEKYI